MNILIFSALYPPHLGGVERYAKNISYTLKEMGHNVTIATSALYKDEGITDEHGITIYRFPCYAFLEGRMPVVRINRTFQQMQKKLKESSYDCCMINTRFYTLSLYAARFAYKQNINSFVLDHGSAHLSFGKVVLDFIENIYEHTITWLVKRYCSRFYGVSHDSEIFLKHFHIKSEGILHNAIDVAEIKEIAQTTEYDIHKIKGIPSDAIVIAYIGRLIHRKGVLELNEAVSRLIDKYPQLYLIYAGDGELQAQLEKQKSPHTIVLGKLQYAQAIKLMEQSDIFCLPSETEGFPTSVLEAAACKTFIITTTTGGSKEMILNDSYGIIMNDNKPETIEKAIDKAMEINYRERAVENCFKEVENNYSWEEIAKKIVSENEY